MSDREGEAAGHYAETKMLTSASSHRYCQEEQINHNFSRVGEAEDDQHEGNFTNKPDKSKSSFMLSAMSRLAVFVLAPPLCGVAMLLSTFDDQQQAPREDQSDVSTICESSYSCSGDLQSGDSWDVDEQAPGDDVDALPELLMLDGVGSVDFEKELDVVPSISLQEDTADYADPENDFFDKDFYEFQALKASIDRSMDDIDSLTVELLEEFNEVFLDIYNQSY